MVSQQDILEELKLIFQLSEYYNLLKIYEKEGPKK
jgi:hypothetical protein